MSPPVPRMGDMEQNELKAMDRIARRQYGLITKAQLEELGLSRSTRWEWDRRGLLIPVGRRTWRLRGAPVGWMVDVAAACLDLEAVASHWTAAELHGLTPRRPVIDVVVAKGRTAIASPRSSTTVRVHTSCDLPRADVPSVEGIRSTSVARTLLDLGALVPAELTRSRYAEIVGDAVDRDLASDTWVWSVLEERRERGRRGVTALESVLCERAELGPTESWLERVMQGILVAAGLPLPSSQRVIRRSGRFAARVDFIYEQQMAVMEALGYRHHRTAEQVEADTRRANALQLQGFAVYQFSRPQIVNDPESIVSTVRQILSLPAAA